MTSFKPTLMTILQQFGIRQIFNAFLENHRLFQDRLHKQWKKDLQEDPHGMMREYRRPSVFEQRFQDGKTYKFIRLAHDDAEYQQCFQLIHNRIELLDKLPTGFYWKVQIKKGATLYYEKNGRRFYGQYDRVVMAAKCADLPTAIRMRNDYINFGYFPPTDTLRINNFLTYLEFQVEDRIFQFARQLEHTLGILTGPSNNTYWTQLKAYTKQHIDTINLTAKQWLLKDKERRPMNTIHAAYTYTNFLEL